MCYGLHYVAPDDGWYLAAELKGPGLGCADLTEDLMADPAPSTDVGMPGAGPLDIAAGSGQFNFALNNAPPNSGNVLGYYSPENVNCRPGFHVGIRTDFYYMQDTTPYHKFCGWLNSIDPRPGKSGDRKTLCQSLDWFNEAAKGRLFVATQLNVRADEILDDVFSAVARPPIARSLDQGDSTFAYSFDSSESESESALTEIQRVAQSEFGRCYQQGDTVYFKNRTSLIQAVVDAVISDDDIMRMNATQEGTLVLNRVFTTIHPRRVDAVTTTVLVTLQGTPSVPAGESITLNGRFTDPAMRAIRVGGTDMRNPVATTDYTMNSASDGSGVDLTSQFTVTATYYASTVRWVVKNNSATTGYITLLQGRGRGIYDYDPVDVEHSDSDSIAAYGEASFSIDMTYLSDQNTADAVGDFILQIWKSPQAIGVDIEVMCLSSDLFNKVLALGPGKAVGLMETVSGISSTYHVQSERVRVEPGRLVYASYLLKKVISADYWTLGVVGLSELGETTILAPL